MRELRYLLGIDDRKLAAWHRAGQLNEQTLDAYVATRALRKASLARALRRGVSPSAWRMRRSRGAGFHEAALSTRQFHS